MTRPGVLCSTSGGTTAVNSCKRTKKKKKKKNMYVFFCFVFLFLFFVVVFFVFVFLSRYNITRQYEMVLYLTPIIKF